MTCQSCCPHPKGKRKTELVVQPPNSEGIGDPPIQQDFKRISCEECGAWIEDRILGEGIPLAANL
jgi:hypothetical protein